LPTAQAFGTIQTLVPERIELDNGDVVTQKNITDKDATGFQVCFAQAVADHKFPGGDFIAAHTNIRGEPLALFRTKNANGDRISLGISPDGRGMIEVRKNHGMARGQFRTSEVDARVQLFAFGDSAIEARDLASSFLQTLRAKCALTS
jgi:hypothetical protein